MKHHRYPVDIKQEILVSKIADSARLLKPVPGLSTDKLNNTNGTNQVSPTDNSYWVKFEDLNGATNSPGFNAIITWYLGCWFENFSVTYGVDNAVINEEGSIKVTDISGFEDAKVIIPFALSGASSRMWPKAQQTTATNRK